MGLSPGSPLPPGLRNLASFSRRPRAILGRLTSTQRNVLLAICLGLAALQILGLVRLYFQQRSWAGVLWALPGTILWLAVFGVPSYYLWSWRAVEALSVVPSQTVLRLGEAFDVTVRLTPHTDFELERLAARLVSNEYVVRRGSGRDDPNQTFSSDRVHGEQVLLEHQTLPAGAPQEWRVRFKIPISGMHTIEGLSWSLTWRVEARARRPHLPELAQEVPVTVLAEEATDD